jgi:cytoskeletal protein CcmA (bactofilin family)
LSKSNCLTVNFFIKKGEKDENLHYWGIWKARYLHGTYQGMDNKQSERKGSYNMNKIIAIKEVEMSKHILKGLIVFLLIILMMTFTAVIIFAFDVRSGDIVTVTSGEVIDGDLYIAGKTIIIDSTINGDLIAAGRTILINGTVNGSIIAAGETVNINGEVTHAVRVIGRTLNISGTIGRDLLVAGEEFSMASTSEVGGDLLLGAGSAFIDGLIKGDINSGVKSLTIASTASIQGKLNYISGNEANIQSGAQIKGTINHKLPEVKEKQVAGIGLWWIVIGFLMTLVLGIVIILLAPRRLKAVTESIRIRPWVSLGWGAVILVVIPIASLIACITIIGLPLGLIALALYIMAVYITQIFVGLFIGQLIIGIFKKVETRAALVGALALGLAILRVLGLIPFAGFFFGLVTVLFGLGAILVSKRKLRAEE